MKISTILQKSTPGLSLEVFPPKSGAHYETVADTTRQIAELHPDYISVTYGASGGTSQYTISLAQEIQDKNNVPVMAHLTCVSSTRQTIRERLSELREKGIDNILALRGDLQEGVEPSHDYAHAAELVREIKEYGGFSIGGACYPEGHTESGSMTEDILHLKEKVDAGCEFLITQMFFDNSILYNFLYKVRERGITVPVVPGIMPVTNGKQIQRITALSGTYLPARFKAIVDRFGTEPDKMKQVGIIYATEQIIDLFANGVNHVHVYTMNQPEVASGIMSSLSEVLHA